MATTTTSAHTNHINDLERLQGRLEELHRLLKNLQMRMGQTFGPMRRDITELGLLAELVKNEATTVSYIGFNLRHNV